MIDIDSYSVLGIAPILSAPAQLLYLKAGRRYDVGAILYLATGAFLAATWGNIGEVDNVKILSVLELLLPIAALSFALRITALSLWGPMQFTLISLAQMWAVVPLVTYGLQRQQEFSGIYLGQIASSPLVLTFATIIAAIAAYLLARMRLPTRLRAASDNPLEYDLLIGSRLLLALKVEGTAVLLYLTAGAAFRIVHSNLSAPAFGTESLWMLLSVAALPRFRWYYVIFGPIAAVLLRYFVASVASPEVSTIFAYVFLAMILALTALGEVKFHRVKRA